MLILISPAKSLDFKKQSVTTVSSQIYFPKETLKLVKKLKGFSATQLSELMKISASLSELNFHRFQNWKLNANNTNAKQALFTFTGEVYRGLKAVDFTQDDVAFAQEHLRILSGLYGVLKPLDLIQAYRLEMGIKLKYLKNKNLYQFWGEKITNQINKDLDNSKIIVNLASKEYYKSIIKTKLKAKVITPIFKDFRKGEIKVITVYAKNARGRMTNFIIKNRIENPEDIKAFDSNGYSFDVNSSDDDKFVFIR